MTLHRLPKRRTIGVFASPDTAVDDPDLLHKADHLSATIADRDALDVTAGPVFVRVIDDARIADRYGSVLYERLPTGTSIFEFEFDALPH